MPAPKDPEKKKEWIEKLRKAALRIDSGKWLRGRAQSKETVEKRRESLKRTYNEPEMRKRCSEIAKANGCGKWMKGKKAPGVSKANLRRKGKTYKELYGDRAEEQARARKDSNRKRWEGKPRKQRSRHNGDYRYGEWRTAVFERDDHTCQACLQKGVYIEAHHIKSWSNYPDLRYDVSNGETLCRKCHKEEHTVFGIERR